MHISLPPNEHEYDAIDLIEEMAESNDWDYERVRDNQVSVIIEGETGCSYSITVADAMQGNVRLVATCDLPSRDDRHGAINDLLNIVNDRTWEGYFTHWSAQQLLVWRSSLRVGESGNVENAHIAEMLSEAVTAHNTYHRAFQLAASDTCSAAKCLKTAIGTPYGTA